MEDRKTDDQIWGKVRRGAKRNYSRKMQDREMQDQIWAEPAL